MPVADWEQYDAIRNQVEYVEPDDVIVELPDPQKVVAEKNYRIFSFYKTLRRKAQIWRDLAKDGKDKTYTRLYILAASASDSLRYGAAPKKVIGEVPYLERVDAVTPEELRDIL